MSKPKTWVLEAATSAMIRNCSPSVSCDTVREAAVTAMAKKTRL